MELASLRRYVILLLLQADKDDLPGGASTEMYEFFRWINEIETDPYERRAFYEYLMEELQKLSDPDTQDFESRLDAVLNKIGCPPPIHQGILFCVRHVLGRRKIF